MIHWNCLSPLWVKMGTVQITNSFYYYCCCIGQMSGCARSKDCLCSSSRDLCWFSVCHVLVPGERGSGDADVSDSDSVRVLMQCPNNRQNLHLVVKKVRMVLWSHTHTRTRGLATLQSNVRRGKGGSWGQVYTPSPTHTYTQEARKGWAKRSLWCCAHTHMQVSHPAV